MPLVSEILKQAGFIQIHNPFKIIRHIPYLDGFKQYWVLSEPYTATVVTFTIVKHHVGGSGTDSRVLLAHNNNTSYVVLSPAGVLSLDASVDNLTIDDVLIPSGTDIAHLLDGTPRVFKVTFKNPSTFDILGRGRYVTQFFDGAIYNLKADEGLVIPMTEKGEQDSTQTSTSGSITASMSHYSEESWYLEGYNYTDYIARLDGLSQYWQLDEALTLLPGDDYTLSMELSSEELSFYIFGSEGTSNLDRLLIAEASESGAPLLYGLSFSADPLNGDIGLKDFQTCRVELKKVGSYVSFSVDGTVLATSNTPEGTSYISRLGGPFEGSTQVTSISGYVRNFVAIVNGVEVVNLPLTKKEQKERQMSLTGSNFATLTNYTSEVWEDF